MTDDDRDAQAARFRRSNAEKDARVASVRARLNTGNAPRQPSGGGPSGWLGPALFWTVLLALAAGGASLWLDRERGDTAVRVLPGDLTGNRLVAHIAAYRTQRGHDVTPGRPRQEIRHFFVEPLLSITATADRLSSPPLTVILSFAPARHAQSVEFGGDVFARILAGFHAALHLQLGDLTK